MAALATTRTARRIVHRGMNKDTQGGWPVCKPVRGSDHELLNRHMELWLARMVIMGHGLFESPVASLAEID